MDSGSGGFPGRANIGPATSMRLRFYRVIYEKEDLYRLGKLAAQTQTGEMDSRGDTNHLKASKIMVNGGDGNNFPVGIRKYSFKLFFGIDISRENRCVNPADVKGERSRPQANVKRHQSK